MTSPVPGKRVLTSSTGFQEPKTLSDLRATGFSFYILFIYFWLGFIAAIIAACGLSLVADSRH